MSSIFYDCLTIIGGVTVVCLAVFLVICAWSAIDEGIKDLKRA